MAANNNCKRFHDLSLAISVDEAEELIGHPNTLFVDTRNYWKYVKGHIPGAVNFETYAFHWVDTSTPGLRAFNRQMGFLFSSLGVDSSKTVIFYQNNTGYDAARGVWLLWYLGHRNAKILDGGLNAWRRKKLPMDTRDGATSTANFKPRPNPKLLATFAEVMGHVKQKGKEIQILDVRSKGEFLGQNRRAVKGGHIPSAKNIDWTSTLRKDGSLKTASNLEKLYFGRGVEATKDTITYCQSGYRAAHSWLVLKLLGFNVKNYLGSWYEWGNRSDSPISS